MEFSAAEQRLLTPGAFRTCRSWKMWNFFADFAAVVAWCTAKSESRASPRRYEAVGPVRLTLAYGFDCDALSFRCLSVCAFPNLPTHVLRSGGADERPEHCDTEPI